MENLNEIEEPLSPIIKRKKIEKRFKRSVKPTNTAKIESQDILSESSQVVDNIIDDKLLLKEIEEDFQNFPLPSQQVKPIDNSLKYKTQSNNLENIDNKNNNLKTEVQPITQTKLNPQGVSVSEDFKGFQTASGRHIKTDRTEDVTKKLFLDILKPNNASQRQNKYHFISKNEFLGFDKDEINDNSKINLYENLLNCLTNSINKPLLKTFKNKDKETLESIVNENKVILPKTITQNQNNMESQNNSTIKNKRVEKVKSIFSDFNFDDVSEIPEASFRSPKLKTESNLPQVTSFASSSLIHTKTDNVNTTPKTMCNNAMKPNSHHLIKRRDKSSIFGDFNLDDISNIPNNSFSTPKLQHIRTIEKNISKSLPKANIAKTIFSDFNFDDIPEISKSTFTSPQLNKVKSEISMNVQTATPPKTIGNRVTSIFGDMNFDDLKIPLLSTPEKPFVSPQLTSSNSNVKKNQTNRQFLPPKLNTSFPNEPSPANYNSLNTLNSSIKRRPVRLNDIIENKLLNTSESVNFLTLQKPTKGDPKTWFKELENQRVTLEKKLEVIYKKQELLQVQISGKSSADAGCSNNALVKNEKKLSLKDLFNREKLDASNADLCRTKIYINPQNAVLVHFFSNENVIICKNGCTLITNQNNTVGISEVEAAFSVMPGVKNKLIPFGWIKNHYKWIVWKLASYERFFPHHMAGCLTLENVIHQLKLRYDKEIFNASRPAIRKIYEKDDASQKRMVLCVSNIIKDKNKVTELELTDGWYSIRAIIDQQLSIQVQKERIKIGLKLIVSGSELLNCSGCYPLENEASKVRLKINYNSTKRAAWYTPLGFQKNAMAFPVSLSNSHIFGGKICCTEVYILRIYPILYAERVDHNLVWRNESSENKRAQEYEILKSKNPLSTRNVTPVLKILVLDSVKTNKEPFKLYIWNPNDSHLDYIKENNIFQTFNVMLRDNKEVHSTKITQFNFKQSDITEYSKYKRKFVDIDDYETMLNNSVFGEIDTVGIVVDINIKKSFQWIWVTNLNKKLLLIKTLENVVFNRVQEKDAFSFCNIKLNGTKDSVVQATACSSTVVSTRSRNESLNAVINNFKNVPQNIINNLVEECIIIINTWKSKHSADFNVIHIEDENILSHTQITSTDVAMSLIDIEEVVNKTR